ncbi:DNA invertase Pin-like site-specific DNA recombinase [Nocardioides aromaticivorans]|uniref:DNA invertase Pin-like site-specific DNA recombinase n=1 Tax=Nocardioides aromaticivorans TaxID=200618 RepID=A0A7Z0CPH2_9ACTN|nr:recombinase family protein [Nocardioides aromaticivorans]NYI46303.1 DNA invertase Pin-like site-specific DNA recombinase [Nocardioides aromaticivorans]
MQKNRAAIYTRISQDRTGAGLGVDRQEQDCRAKAEELGLDVVAVFSDNDTSAYRPRSAPATGTSSKP